MLLKDMLTEGESIREPLWFKCTGVVLICKVHVAADMIRKHAAAPAMHCEFKSGSWGLLWSSYPSTLYKTAVVPEKCKVRMLVFSCTLLKVSRFSPPSWRIKFNSRTHFISSSVLNVYLKFLDGSSGVRVINEQQLALLWRKVQSAEIYWLREREYY